MHMPDSRRHHPPEDIMHRATNRILLSLAIAAVAVALVACSSPSADTGTETSSTPVPTSSVEPTVTAPEGPATSSGTITTPSSGSAARAAILAAVSKDLGLSGKLTVIQLFAQGTAAVGDIQPASGSRVFFAATGGPGDWAVAWSALYGSKLADVDALEAAAPLVSPELAARLVWNKKAPAPTAKAPTLASFTTFAMKQAREMAGVDYAGTFTVTAKIAKDSAGAWWGNAIAEPSEEGLESIGIWGRYSGGKWTGEFADFSSEDAEAGFFPPDVLAKLAL
jgi:hypothetical protein